jgi:hypothetical protein
VPLRTREGRSVHPGHSGEHRRGGAEIRGAENNPGKHDAKERDSDAEDVWHAQARVAPRVVSDEKKPVQSAPNDERPARTVPQAAQQHRDHHVHVAARRPATVAAERDVEILAQETRQRHTRQRRQNSTMLADLYANRS